MGKAFVFEFCRTVPTVICGKPIFLYALTTFLVGRRQLRAYRIVAIAAIAGGAGTSCVFAKPRITNNEQDSAKPSDLRKRPDH
eukprot:scaffold2351_cov254-Chaetoceros_neogracile.AAC.1